MKFRRNFSKRKPFTSEFIGHFSYICIMFHSYITIIYYLIIGVKVRDSVALEVMS